MHSEIARALSCKQFVRSKFDLCFAACRRAHAPFVYDRHASRSSSLDKTSERKHNTHPCPPTSQLARAF
jgi:hypothetical protein